MACRPKDLPTVDEVLAMSLPQQVMITALVAASWTKPQADGRILDNIQQQHRMSKKYMWYLFSVISYDCIACLSALVLQLVRYLACLLFAGS